jgi:lysophospholipase L1-like esterase
VRRLKLLAFQALFAAVLLEVLLRVYNPMPFRVRGDRIVLPVHQSYTFDNRPAQKLDAVTHHTKNSLGFRGPEPPRDFARRLTILTIGGSTTECLFLSDGKTWTDAMSRALAARRPDVWVNNAGLDGQSTHGHLVLLRDFVVDLRPKVALFLVGTNDVGLDGSNTFDSALTPAVSLAHRAAQFAVNHSEILALAQNIGRVRLSRQRGFGHSEIDVTALTDLVLDDAVFDATRLKYAAFLPAYAERLGQIVALCQKNGIEPVLLTQPALFGDVIDPATGVDLARKQVNGRGNGRLEWTLLEMYNDVTRKVASDKGVALIDLARTLPKDSRLFYDFLHFTNEGAERVGSIVAAALEPHLRARNGSVHGL